MRSPRTGFEARSVRPPVYIAGAARTPIGRFLGGLAHLPAPALGAHAIAAALERAGLAAAAVEEVVLGCVLGAGTGQAPARQAALGAGLPLETRCTTVNKVCGSGLQALVYGARTIALGEAEVVIAGGMESMSQAPHLCRARSGPGPVPGARTSPGPSTGGAGWRTGHRALEDALLVDGLVDPFSGRHMGEYADDFARGHDVSRARQDDHAAESYRRAQAAAGAGWLAREIAPLGDSGLERDEEPGRFAADRLPLLPPTFSPGGTVTAGNASKIDDGAAALVLFGAAAARHHERPLRFRVRASAGHAGAAADYPLAPARAIERAAARAGLSLADIELFEINEAFALVPLVVMDALRLSWDRVNVLGGAVSLGHPIGCSGARIVVTLLNAMELRGARLGCAALCLGGGEALALVIEQCGESER
jgi:acetyl-CoA C-acetyltransferase